MWESRVLCEISKSLWKPFCGFHRDVISTAVFVVFVVGPEPIDAGLKGRLYPYRPADRRSSRLLDGLCSGTEPSNRPGLIICGVWTPRALVRAGAPAAVARAPAALAESDPCDSS